MTTTTNTWNLTALNTNAPINIKLNRTRRSRGYNFEHTLIKRFNSSSVLGDDEWTARRLGGSSTGLPDIVAVNNKKGILLTIEAKSGTGDVLYVPPDQIERCQKIRDMFSYYPERHIILAFKFMNKKRFRRKNETVYENRKMVEYYKVADSLIILQQQEGPMVVRCNYDGETSVTTIGGTTLALVDLPEYQGLPWR